MKKMLIMLLSAGMLLMLCSCSSGSSEYESANTSKADSYAGGYDVKKDTDDWMKEQADGKDYGGNDGGSYYCMGKNDTCPNKTHNAYDLFCDSCDPDGDNIEG